MLSCLKFPFFDAIIIISAIGFSPFNYSIITIQKVTKLNTNQVQTQLNDGSQHYSQRTLEVTAGGLPRTFLFNKCVIYLCQSN